MRNRANVGSADALVRWILAAAFFVAAIVWNHIPLVALLAALIALVMAGTALTRVCPIYRLLGVSTCKLDETKGPKGPGQP
ncbi:MAG: hypothetical protein KatS3mg081_1559 [Gemmatimonadales bacterium]|nr:hypothetical protein HRbin33_00769 [bacterium HR33]GIW52204.1 MAG: hypothetical protein KatS3mg081_1559 [Gemmatimonadales bacterium]